MKYEKAMEWARRSASLMAQRADDGDKEALADLNLMATAYMQGWWQRDWACQRAAKVEPKPTLWQRLTGRVLAADGSEC